MTLLGIGIFVLTFIVLITIEQLTIHGSLTQEKAILILLMVIVSTTLVVNGLNSMIANNVTAVLLQE